MKVLHVYNHFHPSIGGIEKYIEDVCLGLISLGHTSDVCCLDSVDVSGRKLPAEDNYRGITIYRLPCADFRYYKVAKDMPRLIRIAKRYDIINVYGVGFFSDFLLAKKGAHKKPVVVSTVGGIFHTNKILGAKKLYFDGWCRLVLRRADRIIAISEHDRKLFSRITRNIEVIPVPVRTDKFRFTERKKSNFRMLYIGRISRNKRVDRLIDVVKALVKKEPKTMLYIVGRDWEGLRASLEKKVRDLGVSRNVKFTGEVDDREMAAYMKKSTFFVSASEYESFGISAVEAMAAGMVVVLNGIDSFRYFVSSGRNGYITDFSKPAKVADIIEKLNRTSLSGMSLRARKRVKEFAPEAVAKATEKLYDGIIKRKKKSS